MPGTQTLCGKVTDFVDFAVLPHLPKEVAVLPHLPKEVAVLLDLPKERAVLLDLPKEVAVLPDLLIYHLPKDNPSAKG